MDQRLSRRRDDACRCGSPCPPLDDLRNERRKLSTSGRRRPCIAPNPERQRPQERQRGIISPPNNGAPPLDAPAAASPRVCLPYIMIICLSWLLLMGRWSCV